MKILLPILLILLALVLLGSVQRRFVSNETLKVWANIAGIVSAAAAIILLIIPVPYGKNNSSNPGTPPENVSLKITSPENGAEVGQFVAVEGYTKYKKLNHYIVVASQTGTVWVTDGPLLIPNSGYWTGRAQLGTGDIGKGEFFLIYVVATTMDLPIGETSLSNVKNFSSAIATVKVLRRY